MYEVFWVKGLLIGNVNFVKFFLKLRGVSRCEFVFVIWLSKLFKFMILNCIIVLLWYDSYVSVGWECRIFSGKFVNFCVFVVIYYCFY